MFLDPNESARLVLIRHKKMCLVLSRGGRLMSRTAAKETLSLDEYRQTMSGVCTTSVSAAALDEAPMAYKALSDIIDVMRDSVDVIEVLRSIYNFKAAD